MTFIFISIFLELKTVDDDFQSTRIDMDGLRRNANESDQIFLKRVNRLTHQRRIEADFAAKYNVEIMRNHQTGEIKLKKKPKDEIDELMKKRRAEAKRGKKKFDDKEPVIAAPRLTGLQKLQLKKNAKKLKKLEEKSRAFEEYHHEEIKFGETVLAPPSLITPRRATKDETVPRPGTRDLLLTSMLKPDFKPKSDAPGAFKPNKIFTGPVDKKGKRKKLPNSTRLALETERQNVVELYRQLKKKEPIVKIGSKNIKDF